jgi:hypothetical protein
LEIMNGRGLGTWRILVRIEAGDLDGLMQNILNFVHSH